MCWELYASLIAYLRLSESVALSVGFFFGKQFGSRKVEMYRRKVSN